MLEDRILLSAVLGGQIFSTGGNVQVEVISRSSAFTYDLYTFKPGESTSGFVADVFIVNSASIGSVVDIGSFWAGQELVLGIITPEANEFLIGPGSRNLDGIPHATVDFIVSGVANIRFEDLFGGGDNDFNDAVFQVRGAITSFFVGTPDITLLLGDT